MNFNNKKIQSLTGKVSSFSISPAKHKRYRLPIIAILIITLILASSFLVFFTDKLFTSHTTDTQPNIPPINPPYTTPQLLWKTDVGDYIWGISAVTNGIIYTTTGGMAKTINATDGNIIWEQKIMSYGYPLSSPIINGKTIYVNSALGLLALNATDGKTMCRYTYGGWMTPVVFNGVVYAVGDDVVFALNANTGKKLWEYTTKDSWSLSAPVVANNIVYVNSNCNSVLYALNAKNGKLLWTTPITSSYERAPAVANDIVYVSSDDHKIYALNAKTGEKIWTSQIDSRIGTPTVEYGVVYVSSDQNMYALNAANGEKLWKYPIGDSFISDFGIANGVVYICCDISSDMTICALSAANGEKLWSYPIGFSGKARDPAITATKDVIYIGTSTDVYAFSTIQPLKTP